jgi:hypothetical protein
MGAVFVSYRRGDSEGQARALLNDLRASSITRQDQRRRTVTESPDRDSCVAPYVWRLAVPSDHVCVTKESRNRVELENQRAPERRAGGGRYGPDSCLTGYVWCEAFDGDTVCVLPDRRDEVRRENTLASQRIKR